MALFDPRIVLLHWELNSVISSYCISVEDQIAHNFKNHKVYAVSATYDDSKKTVIERPYCTNGFAAAILHAYNYHKHLRLSPDDVWLTISQGVSHHINQNPEKFRDRFVQHEGKEKIAVYAGDILSNNYEGDWPEVVNRLVTATDSRVEKIDLMDLLECNFSTTTTTSLTVSRIVLLDAVKAYFEYEVYTRCGIPKVTLEGTLEDWTKLQEKVIHLRKLNLELDFWLDRLEPVIWNLVATYRSEVDHDFWGRIVKIDEAHGSGGGTFVSGWLMNFFPYNRAGRPLKTDSVIRIQNIPDGIVGVPFLLDALKVKLMAGFIGANQEILEDSNGESVVSPVIGWSIIDNPNDSESPPKAQKFYNRFYALDEIK
ncbi:20427_t:CDS:2 [Dentiscutata erythropus]|uniref:20427_t:CDS:1 n=1 Tax=Dentiscutata erythropus TaxID=1348616 RepID=A0A9N9AFB8_9GLOM|nr:20427_t:CDS:2 [Dentiscutata erythropus]